MRIGWKIAGSVGLMSIVGNVIIAQNKKSSVANIWSPPDKSFTIEVPKNLIKFDGYGESADPNAVQNYAIKYVGITFAAFILRYKDFETKSTDDKLDGLGFMIGGDNDHDFIETNRSVDGLPAREIAFNKQTKRGLFIDAGDSVVVLALAAKTRVELNSVIANRFFNSFKLNRQIKIE